MALSLHPLDLAVLAVYFVVVLGLGLWLARRDGGDREDDYFVAGRRLGWVMVGASLFASNFSSEHVIGLAADGFRTGLAVGNYEWGATIALVVLGTVFVPFYVGSKVRTLPEFLERRYGSGARVYLSLVTILANVLVRISVALYAGALVMKALFGLELWTSIAILAFTTTFYTAAGGLRSVVYTDAIQAVILLVGATSLTMVGLERVGGWSALREALDPAMFDMVRPSTDAEMPWTGLLFGVPVLGIWYWCTDQVIVQRVLGARDVEQGRLGAMFAAFLKITPVFLFVLPGLCGRVLFPETNPNEIFPVMVTQLLPVGIKGLVAAGLIAALMSSIDSTLNSTGTLVSLDFYQRWRPAASPASVVRVGRVTTVAVMAFGMAWVVVVQQAGSLFQYLQQVQAALSPSITAVFLVGVFWPRANHRGAMASLVSGLIVGLAFLVLDKTELWPMPFLVSAAYNFAFSVTVLVSVSMVTEAPAVGRHRGLVWRDVHGLLERITPAGRRRYRILTGILLMSMMALWIAFSG